ncbi:molecular chaperone [Volvox carteri f. nagariensis]|uniref:Molecular chaperone n=1 Tax=Volvox carteri f. nagariensis TaxID=3068 RepID=D8TVG8_VOLCA|nr:molecular chaperone [Volvox carteri f. nagariensis]EFJ48455.1 molecular chaperone [Volvox carteri f. nagariensis]|eukprot:XP_002950254.1 molecular chaperone [Volvox carteri f. nagariensis]
MPSRRSLSLVSPCPYRVLGVKYDANEEDIKAAFRVKAKQFHPDATKDPTIDFKEILRAYERLSDPEERAKYDKMILPRSTREALLHLNARSVQRHGISVYRATSRPSSAERRQLLTTLLDLMSQVKKCTKRVEREVVGKDPTRYGCTSSGSIQRVSVSEADCGEHECCGPWFLYTD